VRGSRRRALNKKYTRTRAGPLSSPGLGTAISRDAESIAIFLFFRSSFGNPRAPVVNRLESGTLATRFTPTRRIVPSARHCDKTVRYRVGRFLFVRDGVWPADDDLQTRSFLVIFFITHVRSRKPNALPISKHHRSDTGRLIGLENRALIIV